MHQFIILTIDLDVDMRQPGCQPEAKLFNAGDLKVILYADLTTGRLQLNVQLMLKIGSRHRRHRP